MTKDKYQFTFDYKLFDEERELESDASTVTYEGTYLSNSFKMAMDETIQQLKQDYVFEMKNEYNTMVEIDDLVVMVVL